MIPVLRRAVVLLLAIALLGACAQEDRDVAASIGDRQITFEELAEYQAYLGSPPEDEASLDATAARAVASTWVRTAGQLEALERAGMGPTDAERLDVELRLTREIEGDRLPPISPSSEIYDDIIDLASVSWVERIAVALTDEFVRTDVFDALNDDLHVSRRLGVFDQDSGTLVDARG